MVIEQMCGDYGSRKGAQKINEDKLPREELLDLLTALDVKTASNNTGGVGFLCPTCARSVDGPENLLTHVMGKKRRCHEHLRLEHIQRMRYLAARVCAAKCG